MKKGLIIFDIDGTAVDSPTQKLPSKILIAATKNLQKDYYICAATGRAKSWADEVIQPLGLVDPSIISGGTSIFDPVSDKLIWREGMTNDQVKKAIEIMRSSHQRVLFNNYGSADFYADGWSADRLDEVKNPYFLELVFVKRTLAKPIVRQLNTITGLIALMINTRDPDYCDIHIINANATKEHAVAELCKLLAVDQKKTIGIGDGHNDLHLFNAVNHKVAMANSVPELKELADEIIGSVKDEGLAEYFELLNKS